MEPENSRAASTSFPYKPVVLGFHVDWQGSALPEIMEVGGTTSLVFGQGSSEVGVMPSAPSRRL